MVIVTSNTDDAVKRVLECLKNTTDVAVWVLSLKKDIYPNPAPIADHMAQDVIGRVALAAGACFFRVKKYDSEKSLMYKVYVRS